MQTKLAGDEAKKSIEFDVFGLNSIVTAVARTLCHEITADGYVLGIEGVWGSGKSTFVNFVAEEINKNFPDHIVIKFEPWLIGERNALLFAFFAQMASKIEELYDVLPYWHIHNRRFKKLSSKLSKNIFRYGEFVGALAAPVAGVAIADPTGTSALAAVGMKSVGPISKFFRPTPPTLEKLKPEIAQGLKNLATIRPNIRFTIVIDDIDRLEPFEALEILRLVRKVADFPLITYVLCFDRDQLSEQIKKALKVDDGHLYLEKIFQNIISVPPQEPFALRRYFRNLLRISFSEQMETEVSQDANSAYRTHTLLDVWAGKLIKTPRDVVRLNEAVKFGWPHLPSSADFYDFVWLQLIKLKAPDLYFWAQRYVSNVGAYRDGGMTDSDEQNLEAQKLRNILLELEWDDKLYRLGLDYFLPGLGKFLRSDNDQSVFDFDNTELVKFEQDGRLGSPSHWRQYFAFEIPSYAIEDDEIVALRRAARDDHSSAAEILLDLAARPHDTRGYFVEVMLDRLSDEPDDSFSSEELSGVAKVFAEVMDDIAAMTGKRDFGRIGIWWTASSILKKGAVVNSEGLFEEGKSVNWLAHELRQREPALRRSTSAGPHLERHWLTTPEFDEAVTVLVSRFRLLGEKIFEKPDPLSILYFWEQLGEEGDVRDFIAHTTESDEVFLSALSAMRAWSNSSSRGVYHPLHESNISNFMDVDAAKKRLKKLSGSGAQSPELRERALELLSVWDIE